MYGKFFASTFTGSMVGAGPVVFSVWAYAIANCNQNRVELNARHLAPIIGCTINEIQSAIEFLCAPDSDSRSKEEDGKRLVKEGQFQYFVVNAEKYRGIRNEDERREYNRLKKREERGRKKGKEAKAMSLTVIDSQRQSNMSANTEAEAEAEASSSVSPNDTVSRAERVTRAREAHIPTIEEIKKGVALGAGIPDDYVEHYHTQNSIKHRWIAYGRLIDWKKDILVWWSKDRQNFKATNYKEDTKIDYSNGF